MLSKTKLVLLAVSAFCALTVVGFIGCDKGTGPDPVLPDQVSTDRVPEPPIADFVGSPTSGEAPLQVTFSNRSTGDIDNYSWNFGNGKTSSVSNPTVTFDTAGTYTVTLTVSGAGGSDTESKSRYISVIPKKIEVVTQNFYTGLLWPTAVEGCGCAFETHKPEVYITAGLSIIDKKVLRGTITMKIWDPSEDCTEGNLYQTFGLYTAPTGYNIVGIVGETFSDIRYWDTDLIEQWHLEYCGLGWANILAETVNDDLCDASLDDRSRMSFSFYPVRILIQKQF